MLRSISLLTICVFTLLLGSNRSFGQNTNEPEILLGTTDVGIVENSIDYSWFKTGYNSYVPNNLLVNRLDTMPPSFSFVIFGGTWCDDTQKLLPAFFKVIDMAGINRNKVMLYFVDKEKKSPEGLEKRYDVEFIPTFIVMENGKEKGRVVETVEKSIEEDLIKIIEK